ncbi:Flagellum-specific peptidoglycan hydrolase FlgJ [Pedobacter westerhofensis]|uniref:Peptidoglycan hydrolase n=1 Tax=Pedobacter westerhofensis TaxID=425512 RepID=A0A521DUN3_9SPHI|nr:glucosaminidase domain-containing protein [Pedobacter westerhofensis]SMO75424.1 Flagellum-specific peptidoglycan hydrolase FlgJ [Pedobacter westerhofensis]
MNLKNLFLTCLTILLIGTSAQGQTIQDYVEEHTDHAKELMREYDVPASVILAVAIHESAAGKSKVARHLNNHFGIKGSNSNTEINSSYRDYETADESYDNFVEVLQNTSSFNKLFDKCDQYDYAGWAKGIQRGGYAASRTWAKQVIAIINKYELYQYDDRPADYTEPVKVVTAVKKTHYRAHARKRRHSSSRMYTVRKGDNLNRLAESHGTSAKALMRKNGLKKSALQPGQKIRF